MEIRESWRALTEIQREIFTSSNQSCGRPCFTSCHDGRQTGLDKEVLSGEMQEQKEPRTWNSFPEDSPTCACWGLTERSGARGGCSSIFETHVKVCSMASHWPGVVQEVATNFLLPTLEKMWNPTGLYVNTSTRFLSLRCLLMTCGGCV